MASSAATMACQGNLLFSPSSTRLLHFHPFQHKHRQPCSISSSPSALNTKPQLIRRSATQYNPATAICGKQSESVVTPSHEHDILKGSTRTLTTIIGTVLLLLKMFQNKIPNVLSNMNTAMTNCMSMSTSTLFFASVRGRAASTSSLSTPLKVVAVGIGKWLDIYSGVLLVRVLLSWFPNVPWERQPLSAIRDLCDPYLSLFRNIIPPLFDTLDISPLFAFGVLGALSCILNITTTT